MLKTQGYHSHAQKRAYARAPRFTSLLPWLEYSEDDQCMLLNDGLSVGAGFQLTPVPCEAKSPEALHALVNQVAHVLEQAVPADKLAPWIIQCYVQDMSLAPSDVGQAHPPSSLPETTTDFSALQAHYQNTLQAHYRELGRPEGYFFDRTVTGQPFIGCTRCVRVMLYRRLPKRAHVTREQAIAALQSVATRFTQQLEAVGVRVRRFTGADFYAWLVGWFNPQPSVIPDGEALAPSERVAALLARAPYVAATPEAEPPPYRSFSERLLFSTPTSFEKGWCFDGQFH